MKDKRFFIFILVILFVFVLAACTRSASQPPSSDEDVNLPLPTLGTQDPMKLLEEMGTQTAVAQEAGAKEVDVGTGEDQPVAEEGTAEEGVAEEAAPEGETGVEAAPEGGEGEEAAPEETGEAGEAEPEAGGGQEPVAVKEYDVPNTYTLKTGEFPYCIARRFNISPSALLSANGLGLNSQVSAGTKLTIPKNADPWDQGKRALRDHPTNYTVVSGDTVYSIACLFGDVDPRAIEDVNGLSGGYSLSAGQVIKIP